MMALRKRDPLRLLRISIFSLCFNCASLYPLTFAWALSSETAANSSQKLNISDDKFSQEFDKLWKMPRNSHITINIGAGRRFDDLADAFEAISGWIIPGSSTVVMQLDGRKFRSNMPVLIKHPYATQIQIQGEKSKQIRPKAFLSSTGRANNWSTTIEFDGAAGASIGDYVIALTTTGSGDHEALRGVFPIVKVEGSSITVRNTGWFNSFPLLSLTGGLFVLVKSVLRFEDSDGIVVAGSHLGLIRDLVIEGNSDDYWDRERVEKTEKGTHGIIAGSPTIYSSNPDSNLKQGANRYGVGASSISLAPYVGVFGFDQQGILSAQSSSVFASSSASSNNKRSGYYSDSASSIWAKSSVASGNYTYGYIADNNSSIVATAKSTAIGNKGACVFAATSSHINIGESSIKLCSGGGVISQNSSLAQIQNARIGPFSDDAKAVFFQHGASVNGDGVYITGASIGIYGAFGGAFRGQNTITIERCGLALRADSSVMQIRQLDLFDNVAKFLLNGNSSIQINGEYIQSRDRSLR